MPPRNSAGCCCDRRESSTSSFPPPPPPPGSTSTRPTSTSTSSQHPLTGFSCNRCTSGTTPLQWRVDVPAGCALDFIPDGPDNYPRGESGAGHKCSLLCNSSFYFDHCTDNLSKCHWVLRSAPFCSHLIVRGYVWADFLTGPAPYGSMNLIVLIELVYPDCYYVCNPVGGGVRRDPGHCTTPPIDGPSNNPAGVYRMDKNYVLGASGLYDCASIQNAVLVPKGNVFDPCYPVWTNSGNFPTISAIT